MTIRINNTIIHQLNSSLVGMLSECVGNGFGTVVVTTKLVDFSISLVVGIVVGIVVICVVNTVVGTVVET